MQWTCADIPLLKGKTIIVTGGNTGIGLATIRVLASKGATVILACRNVDKGNIALAKIREVTPAADVTVEQLDLASLASVKAFADRMAARYPRLDILINNAGVATPPLGYTEDGFETQFGTNVLGHFALTAHLLSLLAQAPAARVISMGSIAHWLGKIDFDNLNAERGYSATSAYYRASRGNHVRVVPTQQPAGDGSAIGGAIGGAGGVAITDGSDGKGCGRRRLCRSERVSHHEGLAPHSKIQRPFA